MLKDQTTYLPQISDPDSVIKSRLFQEVFGMTLASMQGSLIKGYWLLGRQKLDNLILTGALLDENDKKVFAALISYYQTLPESPRPGAYLTVELEGLAFTAFGRYMINVKEVLAESLMRLQLAMIAVRKAGVAQRYLPRLLDVRELGPQPKKGPEVISFRIDPKVIELFTDARLGEVNQVLLDALDEGVESVSWRQVPSQEKMAEAA